MTTTTHQTSTRQSTVHVVLVPGFWLGGWAWDDVLPGLTAAGLTPHAVTLPGMLGGADRPVVTLDDHVHAVVDLVDSLEGEVVLVGHSGGGVVVHSVVDRRPDRVRRAVYVDSGPMRDGVVLEPGATQDIVLPSWSDLEAAESSTDGLDDDARAQFERRAVPQPAGVASAPIRLTDERRLSVPITLICTSFPSEVVQQLVAAGNLPSETPAIADVEYVDLPTGPWPMFSRPADLAAAIAAAARR